MQNDETQFLLRSFLVQLTHLFPFGGKVAEERGACSEDLRRARGGDAVGEATLGEDRFKKENPSKATG